MTDKPEVFDKNTLQKTENKIENMLENGSLDLPPDYSWSNALHSMWLQLQDTEDKNGTPVWKSCTKASVMKGLIEMIMQGLDPSKSQVYPIAYGDTLQMQRSNFGDEALLRRLYDVEDLDAQLIYEGDEVSYTIEDGRIFIDSHEQSLKDRLNNEIVAAYATIRFSNQPFYTALMGIDEIEKAWAQRRGKDKSKAHKNFAGEMAKKTVISRACKRYNNASDDSAVLSGAEDLSMERAREKQVKSEKEDQGEGELIDIDEDEGPDKEKERSEETTEAVDEPAEAEDEETPNGDEPAFFEGDEDEIEENRPE